MQIGQSLPRSYELSEHNTIVIPTGASAVKTIVIPTGAALFSRRSGGTCIFRRIRLLFIFHVQLGATLAGGDEGAEHVVVILNMPSLAVLSS